MISADNRTDYIIKLAELKRGDSVLTIGISNIPEIERIIEKRVKLCACIDLDKNKLNHAKKYLEKTKLIFADILNPPKDIFGKFDTVIMLEVLEHIDNDSAVIKNIHKILKKNGKLILTVPNKHPLHLINPVKYTQHKRHYSMEDIIKILNNGQFKIDFTNTVESPKLIFDLYVHLFCKYILNKNVPFAILTGKKDSTYLKINKDSKGLDSLVVASKI